jgi:hypothetical protein
VSGGTAALSNKIVSLRVTPVKFVPIVGIAYASGQVNTKKKTAMMMLRKGLLTFIFLTSFRLIVSSQIPELTSQPHTPL